MSNEAQYYHPILEAMIASAQNKRDIEHEKNAVLQHKSEMALRDRMQAELEKQHEIENAHTQRQFDLLKATEDVKQSAERMGILKQTADSLRSGQLTPDAFRQSGVTSPEIPLPTGGSVPALSNVGGTPQGMINVPSVGNVPLSGFQNPQQYFQQLMDAERQKAQATAEGGEPSKLREIAATGQNQMNVQDVQAAKQVKKDADELAARAEEGRLNRLSNERISAGHNYTQLQIARESGKIVDPDTVRAAILDYGTGQKDFKGNTPFDRAVEVGAQKAGFVPITTKTIDSLKNVIQLENGFQQFQKFINENLPDESKGSLLAKGQAALIGGLQKNTTIPTAGKTQYDIAAGNILNNGKALEDNSGGRVNVTQLGLEKNSLPTLTDTKQTGQSKLDASHAKFVSKIKALIGGASPEQVQQIEQRNNIKLPEFFHTAPSGSPADRVRVFDSNGRLVDAPTN